MLNRRRCNRDVIGRRINAILFVALACIESGCAALTGDLLSEGTVRLEDAPSETASLSRVLVYEDDGDLVVYGKVSRRAGVKGRVDATVRVIVRCPDGRTLEETKRAFPPYLPIRRSRKSNFTVRFQGIPPAGAVVRIECPPIPARTPSTAVQYQAMELQS